jgi:hypothetical protein
MRWLALLALLSARLDAGAWSLDLGLAGAVGAAGFAGEPAGQDPATFFSPPTVKATGRFGLDAGIGLDLSVQRKRRWGVDLQLLWQGHSLTMDESLDFGGSVLDRQTLWEWQSLTLPLTISYALPVWTRPDAALLGHLGLGAWGASNLSRRKTLSSGVGTPLERPWVDGPAQDWGPLLALGLDWVKLPEGRRSASFELRVTRGTQAQDPGAGAGLPVWSLQGVISVPVWMKVL